MKKIALLGMLLVGSLYVSAQSITRNDDIGRFSRVTLQGRMNVEFTHGELSAIQIELPADAPSDQVVWNVTKDGLHVHLKQGLKLSRQQMPTVRITFTRVDYLNAGDADVIFRSPVVGDLFSGELTSGAKLTAQFECFDMEIRLQGGAVAQLAGKARYLTLAARERSQIDASALEGMATWIEALSNSQVTAQGVERFVGETAAGSTIFYRGEPRILRTFSKMGGSVQPAQ